MQTCQREDVSNSKGQLNKTYEREIRPTIIERTPVEPKKKTDLKKL